MGKKFLVPDVAGYKTIQHLQDHLRGADLRAGSLDAEFRNEIEQIVTQVHLDFIVNVVLNQLRKIAAIFAGDKTSHTGMELSSHPNNTGFNP